MNRSASFNQVFQHVLLLRPTNANVVNGHYDFIRESASLSIIPSGFLSETPDSYSSLLKLANIIETIRPVSKSGS